jgi:hypothetical protein
MTANGTRLYACEELTGDDCGKADAKSIAQAFCQKPSLAQEEGVRPDRLHDVAALP